MKKKSSTLLWVAIGAVLLFVTTKKSTAPVAHIAEGEPTPDPTATAIRPGDIPPAIVPTLTPPDYTTLIAVRPIYTPPVYPEITYPNTKPVEPLYDTDGNLIYHGGYGGSGPCRTNDIYY